MSILHAWNYMLENNTACHICGASTFWTKNAINTRGFAPRKSRGLLHCMLYPLFFLLPFLLSTLTALYVCRPCLVQQLMHTTDSSKLGRGLGWLAILFYGRESGLVYQFHTDVGRYCGPWFSHICYLDNIGYALEGHEWLQLTAALCSDHSNNLMPSS